MSRREPIVNAPTVLLVLIALFVFVQVVRGFLTDYQDAYGVLALGFIPARYGHDLFDLPGGSAAAVSSFVTHMFVHGDWFHLAINSAWLLAFGSPIVRRIGTLRFLIFGLVCGVGGALTFLIINPGLLAPMVGASGAISGLMGGLMRFMFSAIDRGGIGLLQNGAPHVPRMDLGEMLRDRRVVLTIGIWIALNFVFSFGFSDVAEMGSIAWEAHLGGFFVGLLTFGLFDRQPEPQPSPAPPEV